MKLKLVSALLAGCAMCISAPAFAQTPPPAADAAPEPTEPDPSDAAADATIANAQAVDDAQAKIELMQQQIDALQTSIEQMKTAMVKTTPSWKGAPQYDDKDAGFSFKPRGALQFDAGYVGFPRGEEHRGTIAGGLNYNPLGWNSRPRRLLIGADGTLPGGFRYSVEFNLAQATVDYEDMWLAYDFKNSPLTVQAGYFYPFSSLETLTSSKFTSFMERATITDAFNMNRRLGIAFLANDKKADSWVLQAGLFNQPLNDASFTRTGWEAAVRGVYSPMLGDTRLHLGASYHHRQNNRESLGQQYRARPVTQLTDQRFIDTGTIASKGDDVVGLEVGAIHKSLHFAAEAQKVWVRGTYDAAGFTSQNGELDSNDVATGTTYNDNPSFWGGYAEVGYYLTGETRGYKGGKFDRTKVLHPFNDGGWGAFQINGRLDLVDLKDRVGGLVVAQPSGATAPGLGGNSTYVNGGRQIAYQGSLIWNPTDYVRFMAQYAHLDVTGGPRASADTILVPTTSAQTGIFPFGEPTPVNKRKYGVDTFGVRAQVDF
jgi:phosphate-selective porin OprO/OprP